MSKLSKKLPNRVTNDKAKAKRARSWARNQAAKVLRIAEQARREAFNREVGSTGKQRRYNPLYAAIKAE